jgi:para-aminobenzoate synthetase/4-amino-4-deoxychorismate lyase
MSDQSAGAESPFQLLETLLWEPDTGWFLLDAHVRRMQRAAAHFGFALDAPAAAAQLQTLAESLPAEPHRVRLLAAADGEITTQAVAMPPATASTVWRVALAAQPIDSADPFLRHKTTRRQVYETARAAHPAVNDVLLWNERGELTEATIANVVLKFGDDLLTPPASVGLLPGTFREHLLAEGIIREQLLTPADLHRAEQLFLINSVRRWVPAEMAR